MSCLPENAPVTGALRVAFVVLIALLVAAFGLQQRIRPRPSRLLRWYVGLCSAHAFLGMLSAIDLGATEHQLWTGIVAPTALAVFSLHAELFRTPERPIAVAALLRRKHRPPWPRHLVHADQAVATPAFRE
jgi:hypothetical protein